LFKEVARSDNQVLNDLTDSEPNKSRLDNLLYLMQSKEPHYRRLNDRLRLFSFEHVLNNESLKFSNETREFLDVENERIISTAKFMRYLGNKSNFFSFEKPRSTRSNGKLEIVI
jgi:hypothetical protein